MVKKIILLTFFTLAVLNTSQAGNISFNQRIYSPSPSSPVTIGTPSAMTTVEATPKTGPFTDASVIDRITFGVDHSYTYYYPAPADIRVRLHIDQWDKNNAPLPSFDQSITISYHPLDTAAPYIDKAVFNFNNAYKYTIRIDSIFVNNVSMQTLQANLFIDADILIERYYDFLPFANTPLTIHPADPKNTDCDANNTYDEVLITWDPCFPGPVCPEEYQLEWTFVNDYGTTAGNFIAPANLNYDFRKNSTRITTVKSYYRITLVMEHGYLLYRVRAIGRNPSNPSEIILGTWSATDKGTVSSVNEKYYNQQEHEGNKNWQYSASFAEEGKKKEVVSYFDGSLRNRQSVTKINSDSTAVVGETIYDNQGRPAVNVLPVPAAKPSCPGIGEESAIKYYPLFNQDDSTKAYSRNDFDTDFSASDSCNSIAAGMNASSGASNYYSPLNPDKNGFQAFVPDAEKYPFTQVEYTPDNTGRIRKQGGVGPDHQIGTKHETKYFYGQPNQLQLDRFFGTEVGDAAHYKKNLVVDANGQVSISYLDQEGRVVATSLAGDPPKDSQGNVTMKAIPSESVAATNLTIDLFAKDANGKSKNNFVNVQGDAIVFNSQLLSSFRSDYVFTYSLSVNNFTDPCLKANICFSCVYDLEIKVTDDCGRIVIPISGSNPIQKHTGRFTDLGGGNIDFVLTCTPASFSSVEAFTLTLDPGNYTISKTLTVNKQARDFYTKAFIDSVNRRPACLKTISSFTQQYLSQVDTADCNISCAQCIASLGDRDSWVASGKGTELEYDFLLEECGKPCKILSWCETIYEQLLKDVSPGGQYAEFLTTDNTIAPQNFPLSVVNVSNTLPKNVSSSGSILGTANWKNPIVKVNTTNYPYYLNDEGTRSIIPVALISASAPCSLRYNPAVSNCALVFTAADGSLFTYPENLANVKDFVANWKDSWEKSLVQYHPEYCYYEACTSYGVKQSGDKLTSDAFDGLLINAITFQDAVNAGIIKNNYAGNTAPNNKVVDFFTPNSNPNGPPYDPFAIPNSYFQTNPIALSFNINTTLKNKFLIYRTFTDQQGNVFNYSMIEAAAITARCGTKYGAFPSSACADFGRNFVAGNNPINDSIRNLEWALFKNFYLSEKLRLQQKRADEYARDGCKGYNGCVGNENYNPWTSGMLSFPFGNSPYLDARQPCSYYYASLYRKKQRRFNSPDHLPKVTPEEADYQFFLKTGQCPIAFDLQNLLGKLAFNQKLLVPAGENLQTYGEFTQDIYIAVSGGTQPVQFTPYRWQSTASGNFLTGNFINTLNNTSICTTTLDKTGSGIASWNDVKGIIALKYTVTNGSNYEFTALASTASGYKTIKGSTCIKLNDCKFKQSCLPNDLALDMQNLWSALAFNNQLNNSLLSLNNSTYQPFLTIMIKNILGTQSNNLIWNYNSSAQEFELYDNANPNKKTVIKFTNFNPSTFNSGNLTPTVKSFNNITSDYENNFMLEGLNASGAVVVTIEGFVELREGGNKKEVVMGDCALQESFLCRGNEQKLSANLEALLKDVLLKKPFSSNIDLTKSIKYTYLLQSYFPAGLQSTSSSVQQSGNGGYSEVMTFTIQGTQTNCNLSLSHSGSGTPRYFSNLTSLGLLKVTGIPAADGNYYNFFIPAVYNIGNASYTDTIFGNSCLPLKDCKPCTEPDTSSCISCGTVTIVVPSNACRGQATTFSYQATCSQTPQVLWGFGDGHYSSVPTHTYAAAGTYTVSLIFLASPQGKCQDRVTYATINVSSSCGGGGGGGPPPRRFPADIAFNSFSTADSALLVAVPDAGCRKLYKDFVKQLKKYNKSQYAKAHQFFLDENIYPTFESFAQAGLCVCAQQYIDYLNDYIRAPSDSSLPPPVDINHFGPCQLMPQPPDPCANAYSRYVNAVNAYNDYVNAHPEKQLALINFIYSPDLFTINGFCLCVDEHEALLYSIINGVADLSTENRNKIFLKLDIAYVCDRSQAPPCDPVLAVDTLFNPLYTKYDNPCVKYQIELAKANALNAYNLYVDSLTTDIAGKYMQHCLGAVEIFSAKYTDKEYHFTLYYYDQAGNLIKTVPPEGVSTFTFTSYLDPVAQQIIKDRAANTQNVFTDHAMNTVYDYNSLNQLIRQCLPDHDKMDFFELSLPNGLDPRLKVTASQFVTERKGYLTGYVDISPSIRRGYLYTTDDGGITWSRMEDVVASDLQKVQMVDATTGYAVGTHSIVLKTIDGGNTWDMMPLYNLNITRRINDLFFNNASTGVIVGNGFTLRTTNGGTTFTAGTGITASDTLTGVTFDGTNYYVSASSSIGIGKIYKSANGTSWTLQTSIRTADLLKVQFINNNDGFAVGIDGNLLTTTNGGAAWTAIPTGIVNTFRDIYFKNANEAVALIDSILNKAQLWKTFNAGRTWTLLSKPGEYYKAFYFYQADKGYAVGEKGIIKRIVMNVQPYGLVNITSPTTTLTLTAVYFFNPDNGWIGGANGLMYYTSTGTSNNAAWTQISGTPASETFKEFTFTNVNTGLLLTQSGKAYKAVSPANNVTAYAFTQISVAAENFVDIEDKPNARILAFDKNSSRVKYVNKNTLASATAFTAYNNTGTPPTGANINIIASRNNSGASVIVAGINGDIFRGNVAGANMQWTNFSTATTPLPLQDVFAVGTNTVYAVGNEGTLLQTTNGVNWKTIPVATINKLNAIKVLSNNTGLIAGNNATLLKANFAPASPVFTNLNNQISNLSSVNLYDIALNTSGKAYIVGSEGRVLHIGNINLASPIVDVAVQIAGDKTFKGLSYKTGTNNVIVAGDKSNLYQYNGTVGAKIKTVFTPALTDVNFINSDNGYTVGDKGTIRHTTNGGNTWNIILPTITGGSTPVLNGVLTNTLNNAWIIGNGNYAARINASDVLTVITPFNGGQPNLNDIAFANNGFGYIVGNNGVFKRINTNNTIINGPATGTTNNLNALHIFRNSSLIAVGSSSTIRYFDGASWTNKQNNAPANQTFNDVFFYDDRNGYVVGNNGIFLKSNLLTNINAASIIDWKQKSIADAFGVTNPSLVNINTVVFTTRYAGFMGGLFNDGRLNANYARIIKDESELYSTKFFYDRLGRLIISQNTKQFAKNPKAFSYTLYDALGRIFEVAEKAENGTGQPQFASIFGTFVNGKYNPNVIDDAKLNTWVNGNGARTEVTKTFYDNPISGITLPPGFTQDNLRKRVATVTYEEANDNNDLTYQHGIIFGYDIHGNVKSLLQDNQTLAAVVSSQRFKRIDYDYDLISGNMKMVKYQGGQADQFYHKYFYDSDNRITEVQTSRDNIIWDTDCKYFYFKHGPLARVEYGNNKVQGMDYAYTIQGWIKAVNSNILKAENDMGHDGLASSVNKSFAKDAFGYSLGYFEEDYRDIGQASQGNYPVASLRTNTNAQSDLLAARNDLFNGNISNMITTIVNPNNDSILPQGTAYLYDQLNRLVEMKAFTNIDMLSNRWLMNIQGGYDGKYNNKFEYDPNGNITKQLRKAQNGATINDLTYNRFKVGGRTVQNRLYHVNDNVNSNDFPDDIDDQGVFDNSPATVNKNNNYSFDPIGNLAKNKQKDIDTIIWTVYGKVRDVKRTPGSAKKNLKFDYDGFGNRIAKHIYSSNNVFEKSEYYVRDAQNNVMSIYTYTINPQNSAVSFAQTEKHLYGSSRIGIEKTSTEMIGAVPPGTVTATHILGNKHMEGSNHLGNVLTVVTDRKIPVSTPGSTTTVFSETFDSGIGGAQSNGNGVLSNNAGRLQVNTEANNDGTIIQLQLSTTQGQAYTLQYDLDQGTTLGNLYVYIVKLEDGSYNNYPQTFTQGTNTVNFTAGQETYLIVAYFNGNDPPVPSVFYLDNIIVTQTTPATIAYFIPEILSSSDYYPFGVKMKERDFSSGSYRQGFNGKEFDGETETSDFGARLLDGDLGIWQVVDPLTRKYPAFSPYSAFANSPIFVIDIDGRDIKALSGSDAKALEAVFSKYSSLFKTQPYRDLTNIGKASGEFASSHIFTTTTESGYFKNKLDASHLSPDEKNEANALFNVLKSEDVLEVGVVKAADPAAPVVTTNEGEIINKVSEFKASNNPTANGLMSESNKTTAGIQSTLKSQAVSGETIGGGAFGFFPQPDKEQALSKQSAKGTPIPIQGQFKGTLLINPGTPAGVSAPSFGGTKPSGPAVETQSIIQGIQKVAEQNIMTTPK